LPVKGFLYSQEESADHIARRLRKGRAYLNEKTEQAMSGKKYFIIGT
jgi:hypothetical protein